MGDFGKGNMYNKIECLIDIFYKYEIICIIIYMFVVYSRRYRVGCSLKVIKLFVWCFF